MNRNANIVKIFRLLQETNKPMDIQTIADTLDLKYGTVMKYCKDLEDLDMIIGTYHVFFPEIKCKNTNKPYTRKQIKKMYTVNNRWW